MVYNLSKDLFFIHFPLYFTTINTVKNRDELFTIIFIVLFICTASSRTQPTAHKSYYCTNYLLPTTRKNTSHIKTNAREIGMWICGCRLSPIKHDIIHMHINAYYGIINNIDKKKTVLILIHKKKKKLQLHIKMWNSKELKTRLNINHLRD